MNNKRKQFFLSVLILTLIVFSGVTHAAAIDDQTKDSQAYKRAYTLILEEKWAEAIKELDNFIVSFTRSAYMDDARYMKCLAMEKMDRYLEEVFECYRIFIKSFPGSKYVNEAKSNLVRIGHALSKEGKPEYEALIQSINRDEEDEIRIAALYALEDMGDETIYVKVDIYQFQQVLVNIVLNAVHAMPRGGRLHIRLSVKGRALRRTIVLIIQDEGSGIHPSDLRSNEEIRYSVITIGVLPTHLPCRLQFSYARNSLTGCCSAIQKLNCGQVLTAVRSTRARKVLSA